MKPIKNTIQSMFEIGRTYQFLEGDGGVQDGIVIVNIFPCEPVTCPYYENTNICEGIKFRDSSNVSWCGIPKDFREVEE